jgi:hypothetical protein
MMHPHCQVDKQCDSAPEKLAGIFLPLETSSLRLTNWMRVSQMCSLNELRAFFGDCCGCANAVCDLAECGQRRE